MMIKTNNKGFTLVEVMIALVLGLFLTAVVVTVFISSKNTFRASGEISRSQENTRFAVEFLKRDLRNAGYVGCSGDIPVRDFLNPNNPAYTPALAYTVYGWEFAGTGIGDTYDLNYEKPTDPITIADLTNLQTNNSAVLASWSNDFGGLPAAFNNLNGVNLNPLVGSDIIAISVSEPYRANNSQVSNPFNVILQDQTRQTNVELTVVDASGAPAQSGLQQNQILKVGDCAALDLFQNVAGQGDTFVSADETTNAVGNATNGTFRWQKPWDSNALLYTVGLNIYYIATGASGHPSLFVLNTSCGINGLCGAISQELVEGVENMQILYGIDSLGNDGIIDSYMSADQLDARDNPLTASDIKAIKIGLLMRSNNVGSTEIDTKDYELIDSVTINSPDDTYLRFVTNTTVFLNNSGSEEE